MSISDKKQQNISAISAWQNSLDSLEEKKNQRGENRVKPLSVMWNLRSPRLPAQADLVTLRPLVKVSPCVFRQEESVYKAVERLTSPSWYRGLSGDTHFSSWPLKLSLLNSLVMADNDFPLVSGRKKPTNNADSRQTAPKGTKQYSLTSLCRGKETESSEAHVWSYLNHCTKCLIVCFNINRLQARICVFYFS